MARVCCMLFAVPLALAISLETEGDARAAGPFAKGPYIQALGTHGVTIKLELGAPAAASVEVSVEGDAAGDGGSPVIKRDDPDVRAFHAVRVDGLQPATRYAYRVTASGASETGHFTTAPTDARPFRFLAYGDSRSDVEAHALVVRAMQTVASDFLVNTGDMVARGNDPDDWRDLFAVEGGMLRDHCLFVAVGNHELTRADRMGEVNFLRYFAEADEGHDRQQLYGTFRWSNTRFFVLNAMDQWTGDEREWLRGELDRTMQEPGILHRIAVMHWGPFSSGPHGNNPALASGEVISMMRDRKVDLVLAGHDHIYERGEGQGLKYVVTGGSGAPLYEKNHDGKEMRHFEAAYHFVEVAIDGDKVAVTARRPSGGVLEACGFQGTSAWDCDAKPSKMGDTPTPPAPTVSVPDRPSACGCALPSAPRDPRALAAALVLGLAAWRRRKAR